MMRIILKIYEIKEEERKRMGPNKEAINCLASAP
jgi:hypothetical protein